tara:strand:- start:1684 stop:1989 length:306 start_codon:yes stop_codon:yes gene_type:complete
VNYIKLCLPDKNLKIAKQFYKLAKKKYEIKKKEDAVMTYKQSDGWHCFKIYLQTPPPQVETQGIVDVLDEALGEDYQFQIETTSDLVQTPSDTQFTQSSIA